MTDQEIKILIKTIYDGRGASLSEQDLDRLGKAADAGSKDAIAALDSLFAKSEKAAKSVSSAYVPDKDKLNDIRKFDDYVSKLADTEGKREQERLQAAKEMAEYAKQDRDKKKAADAPKPPPLPSQAQEEQGLPPGLRRQVGGALGRIVGIPGLGYLTGIGAGIAAVSAALVKVISLTKEWFEAQREMRQIERLYETIELRIDSIATLQNRLKLHNMDVAMSYQAIERNVNSTQAAIAHLNQLQQQQIALQNELASIEHNRIMSQIALDNLFNPIGKIRAQSDEMIRFYALQKKLQVEAEERSLAVLDAQKKEAETRKKTADERKAAIDAEIPKLEKVAELEAETHAISQKKLADTTKRKEAEIDPLRQLAQGTMGPMDAKRLIESWSQSGKFLDKDQTSMAAVIGRIMSSSGANVIEAGIAINTNEQLKWLAKNRIATLEKEERAAKEKEQADKRIAEAAAGAVNRIRTQQGLEEKIGVEQETLIQEADRKRRETEETIKAQKEANEKLNRSQSESIKTGERLQIFNSTPQNSVPGGKDLGALNQEILDTLKDIAASQAQMVNQWT